jgi:ArsR family transcriptional regulator, arsenate/arsenite/antimonite-responsive transcriptional repressor
MKKAMQQQVRILKALASVPRLEIVRLLREHPQCVNAIVARLGMTQPAVSQHLQLLREVGLIRAEKRGTWIHYAICPETVERCADALSDVFGGWVALPGPMDGRKGCPSAVLEECHLLLPVRQPKTNKKRGVR